MKLPVSLTGTKEQRGDQWEEGPEEVNMREKGGGEEGRRARAVEGAHIWSKVGERPEHRFL